MSFGGHVQSMTSTYRNNKKLLERIGLYQIHKKITLRKSGYAHPKKALICRVPSLRLEDWVRQREQERRKARRRVVLISVFLLPALCIACYYCLRSLTQG